MQKILHSANTRGDVNFGWLQTKYSFRFGNYTKQGDHCVHQNANINLGDFTKKSNITYKLKNQFQGMYVFVTNGTIVVDNETLNKKDAIEVWCTENMALEEVERGSTLSLLEIYMN